MLAGWRKGKAGSTVLCKVEGTVVCEVEGTVLCVVEGTVDCVVEGTVVCIVERRQGSCKAFWDVTLLLWVKACKKEELSADLLFEEQLSKLVLLSPAFSVVRGVCVSTTALAHKRASPSTILVKRHCPSSKH